MAAPTDQDAQRAALHFARDVMQQWAVTNVIDGKTAVSLARQFEQRIATDESVVLPTQPGGPDKLAKPLRNWLFLIGELDRLEQSGAIAAAASHAGQREARERANFLIAQIRRTAPDVDIDSGSPLDTLERLLVGRPARPEVTTAADVPEVVAAPRRPLFEILLDPRSIQWFLAFGGGLFVVGLVLWLYTQGLFDNPLFVAICMAVANLAMLFGGWLLLTKTRYQLAGRAVTLLACLVMPLNLWFYHAQGLITLDQHLWVAGVVISILYAASARVLRDSWFVPIFMAGVAMTGLLLLEDLGRFWQIAAPSTFLVVLGLIGIQIERAFTLGDSPFSRQRFGLAFFYSGHALMLCGLALLLAAQVAGDWLYPLFEGWYRTYDAVPSPVATTTPGRTLALGLVALGMYGYIYSDLVVRRLGIYLGMAAGCLLWAVVLILRSLRIELGPELVIAALSLTALIANLSYQAVSSKDAALARFAPMVGSVLAIAALAIAAIVHVRATSVFLSRWRHETGTSFVLASALCALACRAGAYAYRHTFPCLMRMFFFATALAELITIAGALRQLGYVRWEQQAWVLMLVPIAHALAAHWYRGRDWSAPVLAAGHMATIIMLAGSFVAAMSGTLSVHRSEPANLLLAFFFALASDFYILCAVLHRQRTGVYLATLFAAAAIWQVLLWLGIERDEIYVATFAALGMMLLIAHRLHIAAQSSVGGASPLFSSANGLLSVSFISSFFLGLGKLTVEQVDWAYVGLSAALTACAFVAVVLVQQHTWERWYIVAGIAQCVVTALAIQQVWDIGFWRRAELITVGAGLLLFITGLIGWFREQERYSEMASFGLGFGGLLIALPLTTAVIYQRAAAAHFAWLDELAAFIACVGMLGIGFICQLRWPTLLGVIAFTIYFVTLLLFARRFVHRLQSVAAIMSISGGAIFGVGILLAVFRDRLKTLPERVRERQGIWQVLGWR